MPIHSPNTVASHDPACFYSAGDACETVASEKWQLQSLIENIEVLRGITMSLDTRGSKRYPSSIYPTLASQRALEVQPLERLSG